MYDGVSSYGLLWRQITNWGRCPEEKASIKAKANSEERLMKWLERAALHDLRPVSRYCWSRPEAFHRLRSNTAAILQREGPSRGNIGLLIKRQPVVCVKEEEQLCGICTPDLGEIICSDATVGPLHTEPMRDGRQRLAKSNSPCQDQQTPPARQDAETKPACSSKNIHNPPRRPKTNWSGLRRVLTYTHACLHKLFPDRAWTLEFD